MRHLVSKRADQGLLVAQLGLAHAEAVHALGDVHEPGQRLRSRLVQLHMRVALGGTIDLDVESFRLEAGVGQQAPQQYCHPPRARLHAIGKVARLGQQQRRRDEGLDAALPNHASEPMQQLVGLVPRRQRELIDDQAPSCLTLAHLGRWQGGKHRLEACPR